MSDELTYTVMGDDGNEYGPVSAQQIRDWIRENRLERKTPVKPDNAKDWVFLHMLPEFTNTFGKIPPVKSNKSPYCKCVLILLALLALGAIAYLLLKDKFH